MANQREHLLLLLANIHIRKTHKQTSVLKVFMLLEFIRFGFILSSFSLLY